MFESKNNESQTLMIVSKQDLEQVVRDAVSEVLAERESGEEVQITASEAAKRLDVCRTTLWRWNNSGYLKAIKVGEYVRYRLSDVESILRGER